MSLYWVGDEFMNTIIEPGTLHVNISPEAFHRWATHYLKCRKDFKSPHKFSPVPYFLLCRAIELEIKARHLKNLTQAQVKKEFCHDLVKAYNALGPTEKTLNQDEEHTLRVASDIYIGKGFEYLNARYILTGYSRFLDLKLLDSIASKLIENK
jgi:hypothetical protein